jgi:hypothetical protein
MAGDDSARSCCWWTWLDCSCIMLVKTHLSFCKMKDEEDKIEKDDTLNSRISVLWVCHTLV